MSENSNGTALKPSNGSLKAQVDKPKQYIVKIVKNKLELDPIEPVPINFSGDLFLYARDNRYIPFLGGDDYLPNTLLEARLNSPTQHSCITTIARSLVGKGLSVKDLEEPNKDLLKWMKNVNNSRQTMTEFLIGAIDGERGFGNQFIEIKRGKIGSTKYLKIYNHSILFSRLKSMDDFSDPDSVILSKLIAQNGYIEGLRKKDTREIPLWNDDNIGKYWVSNKDGSESTMLHFKNDVSAIEHYGLPDSISSLRLQVIEGKLAQYNIDNLDNNMIIGGILTFKSGMTQAEAEAQAEEILLTHTGQGKTGRIAVMASEEGLDGAQFTQFNTQKEGSFIEYKKQIQTDIISSNAWDSILAGINRDSTLGNGSNYIRSIWDVKDATLLYPLRTKLIGKVVEPIMKIYSELFGVDEILDYQWNLQTSMPFSYMADLDPNKFFKIKEARQKAGLPPDEKYGEMYLAEVAGPNQPNQFNNGYVQTDGTNTKGEKNNPNNP